MLELLREIGTPILFATGVGFMLRGGWLFFNHGLAEAASAQLVGKAVATGVGLVGLSVVTHVGTIALENRMHAAEEARTQELRSEGLNPVPNAPFGNN